MIVYYWPSANCGLALMPWVMIVHGPEVRKNSGSVSVTKVRGRAAFGKVVERSKLTMTLLCVYIVALTTCDY